MKLAFLQILLLSGFTSLAQINNEDQKIIDSLRVIAESNRHDTTRVFAYASWDALIYISDPQLDIQLNKKILSICDSNLQHVQLSSREYYIFSSQKSKALNNIGLVMMDFGDYISALSYLQKSFQIAESIHDTTSMSNSLNNLGMIYKLQGDPEKSLEYYDRSMELDEDNDYTRSIYLNNIGLVYAEMGDHDKALQIYRESVELSRMGGHIVGEANTIGNIGEIHEILHRYDSAIYYFDRAIELYQSVNNLNGNVFLLHRKGKTYLKMGRPDQAVKFCSEALDILGAERSLNNRVQCHKCLYDAFKLLKNDNKALYHLELFNNLQDSLLNHKKKEELIKSEIQFELEKKRISDSLNFAKEQEVSELKIKEQDAQIQNAFTQKMALFGGLSLVLLFSLVLFQRLKLTRQQKVKIESQKDLLEEKNREILDSITYARRIQEAILPPDDYVRELLPESFILYKPKDIVAGDFYWLEKVENKIVFAAADCTGHGVPGAMVSVVCHNALNRSIREFGLTEPKDILDKTRELVIETFEKSDNDVKDGMDIALCKLDLQGLKDLGGLSYAGANNNLYHISNGELTEYPADKQPIGKYTHVFAFKQHEIEVRPGDMIYIFTDGFADQFGGSKGKKFKYKNLKNLLVQNHQKSMSEQKMALNYEFEKWKGNLEQVDDICIIGVRI